ncbi:di-heme oxidoredictase family protein [Corallococcus coralloides]|uniref:di-heme oxidoredictase family protein n=1 Tax=Corallococcus coralloides TaxID=184914 RepID=UPI00268F331A
MSTDSPRLSQPLSQKKGIEGPPWWRTAPLWGLGLTQMVLPYSGYLHDGRARTLEEAVLWHGGEAERAREGFRNLSANDRDALVRFLRSL